MGGARFDPQPFLPLRNNSELSKSGLSKRAAWSPNPLLGHLRLGRVCMASRANGETKAGRRFIDSLIYKVIH